MISIGCPRAYPDRAVDYVNDDSKYDVRCCSRNGTYCSSKPCQRRKTYIEAEKICHTRGERLCEEHEMNSCCHTGCVMDPTYIWVARQTKGKLIRDIYPIQMF